MNFQDLTGQTLGQYELRQLLGMGGMGAVYRGYQAALKRDVAVKVLTLHLAQQTEFIDRFNREAETAARLEHSHIVPIYDYGTQAGISYVVMRLLTGGSLDKRFEHRGQTGRPLPSLGETARLLKQVASALDYAHSQGVIHRDIKPSNIMFDQQGSAYIVDFGIAKLVHATVSLTGTGVAMGTPLYMSPEQWRAETLTPAADQYALGVMAYQLVTGQPPFDAPTPYALMHKHVNEPPISPETLRLDLPTGLSRALLRSLAKNAPDRFPNAAAFAEAFERAVQDRVGTPTGFFITPLAQKAYVTPLTSTPSRPMPGTTAPPPPSTTTRLGLRQVAQHPLAYGTATLGAVLIVALLAVLILARGGNDPSPTGAGGPSATVSPSLAAVIVILSSPTPATEGPKIAVLPSNTPTIAATESPTPSLTPTATPSPTPTSTPTPTATPIPSETPDLQATAEAMMFERLTQTAEGWTDTPTPDLAATAEAMVIATMTGIADQWTDTPTATNTLVPTNAPLPTVTATPWPTPTPWPTSTPWPTATPIPAVIIPAACDGFLTPRLQVGQQACVSDVEANNIRTYPEGTEIIGQIPPGAVFNVLDGPECTKGTVTVWWYVEYNGLIGWAAEGSRRTGMYWLSPLPCPRSGSSSSSGLDLSGTILEVTQAGGSLNARSQPSKSASRLMELFWGDRVLWEGERATGDGYSWYVIRLYDGRSAYIIDDARYTVSRDPQQTTPGMYTGTTIRITSSGDEMHLRSLAGIDSQEVQMLHTDDRLTVLSGPVYADYFQWWELRLPDGRTGWAVDVPGWWVVE
jgi:serine/threonine protein kinase